MDNTSFGAFYNNKNFGNSGSVENDGSFINIGDYFDEGGTCNEGTFSNVAGGTVEFYSVLYNTGTLINDSTGTVSSASTVTIGGGDDGPAYFSNYGTINNVNGGVMEVCAPGSFYNYGTLSNGADNHSAATITIASNSYFENDGYCWNYGTFANNGAFTDYVFLCSTDVFTNSGALTENGYCEIAYGTFNNTNGGTVEVCASGSFYNYSASNYSTLINGSTSTITVDSGGYFENDGYYHNCGTFTNNGAAADYGYTVNDGTFVSAGSYFEAGVGYVYMDGAYVGGTYNYGTFSNIDGGTLEVGGGGAMYNYGTLNNDSTSTITVDSGGYFENDGTFNDSGTFTNNGGDGVGRLNTGSGLAASAATATRLAVVEAAVQAAVADLAIARYALAYNAAVDLVLAGNTIKYSY